MIICNIGFDHNHDSDFHVNRPHGSGDYLLILLKTPAVFVLDGIEVISEADSFILFSQNKPQVYRAYGPQFTNDWFHFQLEDGDDTWLTELSIPLDQVTPIGELHELSIIMSQLCYETYAANRFRSETIQLYLKLFFIKLSNKIHDVTKEVARHHYNKLAIIRTKIYNQPFLPWTIEGLSHELTMSKSSFQHLYKNFFGVSPFTDLIRSRIEHAKYLLSTTSLPIKKVAEMSGYNHEIHFMRQFKQLMQCTPSQYREEIHQHKPLTRTEPDEGANKD